MADPTTAELDRTDPLAPYRDRFALPRGADGRVLVYLCGNSLGLMPRDVPGVIQRELEAWGTHGVEGHFRADPPWYSYHEVFRETGARLVGARPGEVVMMNSLTVNLHLMLVSFYRPEGRRTRVLIEQGAFPSDRYAVTSHLTARGVDPDEALRTLGPRPGEATLRTEDVEAAIAEEGDRLALVMLGGVHYYSGQLLDMSRITKAARAVGAIAGFDLAHAAGNVPLSLHDWDVDFAVWCSYKYLNAGPGAIAGCFVHERHGQGAPRPRFAGWWGNDPARRFAMDEEVEYVAYPGADGWQVSNPPILAMAPLRVSLAIFDAAGMSALREKSLRLTSYLESLLETLPAGSVSRLTPKDPSARGCQLSLLVPNRGAAVFEALTAAGVVADFRRPDVIRMAPVPLYNTFEDVRRAADAFRKALDAA